jgi:hypothetical protein
MVGRVAVESIGEDKGTLGLVYKGKSDMRLSFKLDLNLGIHHYEEDRAPAYDWETGKLSYGDIATDADFTYLSIDDENISYGMFNGCRIYYKEKEIHSTPRYTTRDFLVEEFKEIDHKWRAWSGTVER